MKDSTITFGVVGVWLALVAFNLALICGAIWVAWHFISKFW